MQITLSAVTHPGHERTNNEDAFAFCPDITHSIWKHETCTVTQTLSPLGSLLLVADGIGGFNAGEVASEIAVRAIAETFTPEAATKAVSSDKNLAKERCTELLCCAIAHADEQINQHILADFHTVGMGTTIVLAWILPQVTYIAWCGDSRCYLRGTDPSRQQHHHPSAGRCGMSFRTRGHIYTYSGRQHTHPLHRRTLWLYHRPHHPANSTHLLSPP